MSRPISFSIKDFNIGRAKFGGGHLVVGYSRSKYAESLMHTAVYAIQLMSRPSHNIPSTSSLSKLNKTQMIHSIKCTTTTTTTPKKFPLKRDVGRSRCTRSSIKCTWTQNAVILQQNSRIGKVFEMAELQFCHNMNTLQLFFHTAIMTKTTF